jgi:hypothetical protein
MLLANHRRTLGNKLCTTLAGKAGLMSEILLTIAGSRRFCSTW